MLTWVRWDRGDGRPKIDGEVGPLRVEVFALGELEANCYLVWCEQTGQAMVIDPGGDPAPVFQSAGRRKLSVVLIVNTHGHVDHIAGNARLRQLTGARLLIGAGDAPMLGNPALNLSSWVGESLAMAADDLLNDGDRITVGELVFAVIYTPGHSPGGICLHTAGAVFTGDTLFAGSIGRSDLPGGDTEQLMRSLEERLMILPGETMVYPGHGPTSTIALEKRCNPFLT
ncbi:MAG TPA: MBL fold metallo-hydrolase [Clostridiales bacterium UBA8153]|nr:MBL fold metallo-hydrolase [Clostridiales bacterium UBA8153]